MAKEEYIEESPPQVPPVRRPSFADLTFRDMWDLVKHYFTAVFVCALIFVLPYALFLGAGSALGATLGVDSEWWLDVLAWGIIALLIVTQLPDVLEGFGRFFIEMGQAARRASMPKRVIVLLLFASYVLLWRKYPTPAFLFSALVFLPAGFTIDRYKKLLREKIAEEIEGEREDAASGEQDEVEADDLDLDIDDLSK